MHSSVFILILFSLAVINPIFFDMKVEAGCMKEYCAGQCRGKVSQDYCLKHCKCIPRFI
uniref:Potassium channel toxin Ts16 n=1 Tax=Tityus serrulatus TaxID=6887 RepID=KA20_TITSE|nr:RecName: Full=Potassium channel toxin Ts16; AltName: Full=Tityustoxin-16; Flags: Precursor [Tityus serrulatus]